MTHNLTSDEKIALLEASSASQWDAVCDQIRAARGGKYPPDWCNEVLRSGLLYTLQNSWRQARVEIQP